MTQIEASHPREVQSEGSTIVQLTEQLQLNSKGKTNQPSSEAATIAQLRDELQQKDTQLHQFHMQLQQNETQFRHYRTQLMEKDAQLKQKDEDSSQEYALLLHEVQQIQQELDQLRNEQDQLGRDQVSTPHHKQSSPDPIQPLSAELFHHNAPAGIFSAAKQVAEKAPRNWKDMKCQKILKCGRGCLSVATKADLIAVGVWGGIELYSKTSNELLCNIRHDQQVGGAWDVAFLDEETIVVSDFDMQNLKLFTTAGQLLRTIDRGQLLRSIAQGRANFEPWGVTVSPDGLIYVCDDFKHCVRVFEVKGKSLFSFGSRGGVDECFDWPRDLCFASDGLLYITDANNSRICVYDKDGKFIRKFPTTCEPTCIDATDCGHLIVSSLSFHKVMIYTTGGGLVRVFGECGSGLGQFYAPSGVSVDSDGLIYIADLYDNRIQVF
jgi:outer membrane protein assembly factor BamB